MHHIAVKDARSPRMTNRGIRLKDELANMVRLSGSRGQSFNRTLLELNKSGTIMNYKVANGIND